MKIQRMGFLLIILLIIILIIPIIITFIKWSVMESTFFTYTLSDLANLISSMIIGVVVTIYFSVIMNSSSKRLDLIISNIELYQEYYKKIIANYTKSVNQQLDDPSKDHIVRIFKLASIEYSNISVYLKHENIYNKNVKKTYEILQDNHFTFKEQITDIPFRPGFVITDVDIFKASEKYYLLKQNIQKLKLCIYK